MSYSTYNNMMRYNNIETLTKHIVIAEPYYIGGQGGA